MISAAMNVMAADDLQTPVETHQAFIQTDQRLPINPLAIVPTDDGLIVAGWSGTRAWAAKTDAVGRILWTYHVEKPAGYDAGPWMSVKPEFSSAAVMPDGSIWLIGSTLEENKRVGLLVHLDSQGKVLLERTILPPRAAVQDAKVQVLTECVRWGDGIGIVGNTFTKKLTPDPPAPAGVLRPLPESRNLAYWVLALDAQGNITFNDTIPSEQFAFIVPKGLDLLTTGSDLVISATTNFMTEVLRLSPSGAIAARQQFPNGFLGLVRPVVPDGKLQLLGTFVSAANSKPDQVRRQVLITLDEQLREVHRQEAQPPISGSVTYRMPDHSFVVFGAEVHDIGERYTSQIMHVDPTLQHKRALSPRRGVVSDNGIIYTAVPLGATGRFVAATLAVVKGFSSQPVSVDEAPGFLRGAVLDFIELR